MNWFYTLDIGVQIGFAAFVVTGIGVLYNIYCNHRSPPNQSIKNDEPDISVLANKAFQALQSQKDDQEYIRHLERTIKTLESKSSSLPSIAEALSAAGEKKIEKAIAIFTLLDDQNTSRICELCDMCLSPKRSTNLIIPRPWFYK